MEERLRFDLQLFAEEEKTEEATPRKRQEARKKGQVAKSIDVNAVIVLFATVLLIYLMRGSFLNNIAATFNLAAEHFLWQLDFDNTLFLFQESFTLLLQILLPVFAVAVVAAIIANVAQVGFLFAPQLIEPNLNKINPVEGFKRMFSRRALMDLLKSLAKIVITGLIAYFLLRSNLLLLFTAVENSAAQNIELILSLIFKIFLVVGGAFAAIAFIDFMFQRWDFNRNLRMTKHEVKEEFKQSEGDPQIKQRLRQMQRQMAQHRMMESVPQATVVITNPVHLAIALRYDEKIDKAPIVLAKGANAVAERIKEIARQYRIPILENKELARVLFKEVDIGEEIPFQLYQAVAEVLAYVYRLHRS